MELHKFCEKKLQIFWKQPVKGNLHIFSFLDEKSGYLKCCKIFCIFEMAWSRAFQKCIIFHFFGQFFFCKHFYYITGFCDKKFNFCKFAIFLQILKVEHKSFLMIFVIFGHKTWDLEWGSNWPPSPAYPGFQVPQQG